MNPNLDPIGPLPRSDAGAYEKARTPKEAAVQFEAVLARQLVRTLTEGLFKGGLAGEEGPAWMEGYRDTQRDMMTQVLTEHLTEDGRLGLADLLLKQWQVRDEDA